MNELNIILYFYCKEDKKTFENNKIHKIKLKKISIPKLIK